MDALFTGLGAAIGGNPAIAVPAALAWGVLSIVLSPCHLASLPLIVGYIGGRGRLAPRQALGVSIAFAVGILLSIGAVGAVTAAAGRIAGDRGVAGNRVLAVVFLLVGLQLMDVIPMPWQGAARGGDGRKGLLGAFILGLVFGLALGPCTFAFLAPVLAVAFKMSAADPLRAILLVLAFSLGHCGVIAAAGTGAGWIQRYLDWDVGTRGIRILRGCCGVLVILAGLWMI